MERRDCRDALVAAMFKAGSTAAGLVISGEPDVGKSALTLAAIDSLEADGHVVVKLSMRDLPDSAAETAHRLGAPIIAVLGSSGVAPVRLLVVDGAEAALEAAQSYDTLVELAAAALGAGLGVVAVTRSDAHRRVTEALSSAAGGVGQLSAPAQFQVTGLVPGEVVRVTETFSALARLGRDPRSRWLLGRPGLIKHLLEGDAPASLPDGALSDLRPTSTSAVPTAPTVAAGTTLTLWVSSKPGGR